MKRVFDLVVSAVAIVATLPLMLVAWLIATVDTGVNGIFSQIRIGRCAQPFRIYKLRTMRPGMGGETTVTTSKDARITRSGAIMRCLKIDELPQLFNVLAGQMSFVGPRPDVPGFADQLTGEDRIILSVRPGITGPAALAFRHEEELLATVEEPESFNREVIWPAKVRINREYVENYSLVSDFRCILATLASIFPSAEHPRQESVR